MKKICLSMLLAGFACFLMLSFGNTHLQAAQKTMKSEGAMQSEGKTMMKEEAPMKKEGETMMKKETSMKKEEEKTQIIDS
jgi:hypothetical protein